MPNISKYVYNITPQGKNTAVIKLIYDYLRHAILDVICVEKDCFLPENYIHLHKGRYLNRVLYVSEVVLKLSKSQNLQEIKTAAGAIALHIETNQSKFLSIEAAASGLLYIKPSDATLAFCLQNLTNVGLALWKNKYERDLVDKVTGQRLEVSSMFTVQYIYARCCSLIELANQQGLLEWNGSEDFGSGSSDELFQVSPTPWLCDRESQSLYFHLPEELLLMKLLVEITDCLGLNAIYNVNYWQKKALLLSQAFDSFWSRCNIFGEVKANCVGLAQARCCLIVITQFVLKRLLEDKLHIYAPSKL